MRVIRVCTDDTRLHHSVGPVDLWCVCVARRAARYDIEAARTSYGLALLWAAKSYHDSARQTLRHAVRKCCASQGQARHHWLVICPLAGLPTEAMTTSFFTHSYSNSCSYSYSYLSWFILAQFPILIPIPIPIKFGSLLLHIQMARRRQFSCQRHSWRQQIYAHSHSYTAFIKLNKLGGKNISDFVYEKLAEFQIQNLSFFPIFGGVLCTATKT